MKKKYKNILIIVGIHLFLLMAYFVFQNREIFFPQPDTPQIIEQDFSELSITDLSETPNLEPTTLNRNARLRLHNIYEALVEYDKNLNIVSGLALSWGKINNTLYEFTLRDDVVFHNGEKFSADDVLISFKRAQNYRQSEIKAQLANIREVQKIDDYTIRIKTHTPDSLILDKLTYVYILPKEVIRNSTPEEISETPIGTGPYIFSEREKNNFFEMRLNENYHRDLETPYKKITIRVLPNKYARMTTIQQGITDILLNVPAAFVPQAKKLETYEIKEVQSLESVFLLFNFANPNLQNRDLREAIKTSMNYNELLSLTGGNAILLNQFVSTGVFGYNPSLPTISQNVPRTNELLDRMGVKGNIKLQMAYTEQNSKLAQLIREELKNIRIDLQLTSLSSQGIIQELIHGESDMYLLGWHFGNGDSDEFLRYLIHSKSSENENNILDFGKYNGISYSNPKVDRLIQSATFELNDKKRLQMLQQAMQIITVEDIFGIPLFESIRTYAIEKGLPVEPRLDGLIDIQ